MLKPNEAMIEEASRPPAPLPGRAPAAHRPAGDLPAHARVHAAGIPAEVEVVPKLAEGALAALDAGDVATHDRLAAEAARDLRDCDVIALAQFSLARAAPAVEAATGRPVLHHAGQRGAQAAAAAAGRGRRPRVVSGRRHAALRTNPAFADPCCRGRAPGCGATRRPVIARKIARGCSRRASEGS